MAAFVQFLSDLFEVGQVMVPIVRYQEVPDFASLRAQEVLASRDQACRLDASGTLPELDMEVALLGASWVYLACQAYVDRAQKLDRLSRAVSAVSLPTPETVHALDLTLCFLPDLYGHARQLVAEDALMELLRDLAMQWPLSAVGIPDNESAWGRLKPWWDQRALRQRYVDRVLARDDGSCLRHPPVVEALRNCLGDRMDTLAGDEVLRAIRE